MVKTSPLIEEIIACIIVKVAQNIVNVISFVADRFNRSRAKGQIIFFDWSK